MSSINSANNIAEKMAAQLFQESRQIIPSINWLKKWIEDSFGFNIKLKKVSNQGFAGLVVFDPESLGCQVFVNESDPGYRQRFTVVHELAHVIKDRTEVMGFKISADIFSDDQEERFCERFSAAYLMPAEIFIQKWSTIIESVPSKIARMSKLFKVSGSAVRYRAEELGLI